MLIIQTPFNVSNQELFKQLLDQAQKFHMDFDLQMLENSKRMFHEPKNNPDQSYAITVIDSVEISTSFLTRLRFNLPKCLLIIITALSYLREELVLRR